MYYAVAAAVRGQHLSAMKVKQLLVGAAITGIAFVVGLVSILVALSSLFFQLAGLEALVQPALITAAVAFVIAVIAMLEGTRRFGGK